MSYSEASDWRPQRERQSSWLLRGQLRTIFFRSLLRSYRESFAACLFEIEVPRMLLNGGSLLEFMARLQLQSLAVIVLSGKAWHFAAAELGS
jgi:hypothetical protein